MKNVLVYTHFKLDAEWTFDIIFLVYMYQFRFVE